MPLKAKLYVTTVLALGALCLLNSLFEWQFPEAVRYATYFVIAMMASTLKVKLPGVFGTFSATSLFILLGVGELSLSQTVILACSGMIVQSLWKAKHKPKLIQILFNVANLAISSTLAFGAGNFLPLQSREGGHVPRMVLAACVLFISNTVLVSGVLALTENRPVRLVWQQWFLWSFPYYLAGGVIAGLMGYSSRQAGWLVSLLFLPVIYLVYAYYRLYVGRQTEGSQQAVRAPSMGE